MSFEVALTVTGLPEIQRQLAALKQSLRNKIVRRALTEAGKILTREAKARAPVQTGLLKKSIGQKVKTYPGGAVTLIVGPRVGFKRQVEAGGHLELRNPVNYAHLVEFGTAHSAAKPFLRPALASAAKGMEKVISVWLNVGLKKELAKVAGGGGKR